MISSINSTNNTTSFQCLHRPEKKEISKKQLAAVAAGTAVIAAGATAGFMNRKAIGNFIKNLDFKKIWQGTKDLFAGARDKCVELFCKAKDFVTRKTAK